MPDPLPPAPPDVTWITLEQLKAQLYITHSWDDVALGELSTAASTAILGYLGPRGDPAWTALTVPADIRAAVLKLAVAMWAGRGLPVSRDDAVWRDVGLLLDRRRDPAIA